MWMSLLVVDYLLNNSVTPCSAFNFLRSIASIRMLLALWSLKTLLPPKTDVFSRGMLFLNSDFNSLLRCFCSCISALDILSACPGASADISGTVQGLNIHPWQPLVLIPFLVRRQSHTRAVFIRIRQLPATRRSSWTSASFILENIFLYISPPQKLYSYSAQFSLSIHCFWRNKIPKFQSFSTSFRPCHGQVGQ